jgi:predicted enzyme related to lactoylglutathione lyase
LITPDIEAAKAFYTKVMGWGLWDASVPGRPYVMFTVPNGTVAGLMDLPPDATDTQIRPGWLGYVAVDDVDAAAARVARLGGVVQVAPTDIGDISRFAIFSDPQAARLALFKWRRVGQQPPAAPNAQGRVGWHELLAADGEKAFAFYSGLFGWQKADTEADEADPYWRFIAGGERLGGVVTKPDAIPVPFWLFYFNVGDIDAAVQRVRAGGGQLLGEPLEVQGGSWIVHCTDPQGATFALEGRRGPNPIGYFERVGGREPGGRGRKWSW